MKHIAIIGFGIVGGGLPGVIDSCREGIKNIVGDDINVKYILDLRDFPDSPLADRVVHDITPILEDPEIEVVAETMGGSHPAYEFSIAAMEHGISVVTSNKEVVATFGDKLLECARKNNVQYLFEASVGGGIPCLRPFATSLAQEKIVSVSGILNGTTNFILTKMDKEGSGFDDVLKEAQDLGYAERNPAADVEGFDACRKIAILSSLACGAQVDFEDIYTEGITKITDVDFKYAKKLDVSIKLIGSSKKVDGGYCAMVAPKMLSNEHPLAGVNGVMNAIFVKGNVLGDVMFYGAGAGKLPTASAVVSDVVEAVKYIDSNVVTIWDTNKATLVKAEDVATRFFVRISGDASERLSEVAKAFGKGEVVTVDGVTGEFAYVTEAITEKEYATAAAGLDGIISMIRYEK